MSSSVLKKSAMLSSVSTLLIDQHKKMHKRVRGRAQLRTWHKNRNRNRNSRRSVSRGGGASLLLLSNVAMTFAAVTWLALFVISTSAEPSYAFNMTLNRDALVFGESLLLTLQLTPSQNMQNASLQLFLQPTLDFNATVVQQLCDSLRQLCNSSETRTTQANQLPSSVSMEVFDGIDVRTFKVLQLIPVSAFDVNARYDANISLQNLSTSDPQPSGEYVIAVLKYWDSASVQRQAATQKLIRLRFSLVPVQISLQLGCNASGNLAVSTTLSGNTVVLVSASVDPRGLPVVIRLTLPTTPNLQSSAASVTPSFPQSLTSSLNNSNRSVLNILQRSVLLNRGYGSVTVLPIDAMKSVNNTVEVLLSPAGDSSSAPVTCVGRCQLNISLLVTTKAGAVSVGDSLSFSAAAYFGQNSSVTTGPVQLLITGPDLVLTVVPTPSVDAEAGTVVNCVVTLAHANSTSDALNVTLFQVTSPTVAGVHLVFGSAQIFVNDGLGRNISDDSLSTGFDVGDLAVMDTITVTFQVQISDAVLIASSLLISAAADFQRKSNVAQTCLPRPCKNGGRCVVGTAAENNYCSCPSDFTGDDCSTRVCKEGWQTARFVTTSCFWFPSLLLTFDEAEAKCVQSGAHLPSLHNQEDQKAFWSFWQNNLANVSSVWIGLFRNAENAWKWTDGTQTNFFNWKMTEVGPSKNKCTISSVANDVAYGWLDDDCSDKVLFFCEDKGSASDNKQTISATAVVHTKPLKLSSVKICLGEKLRIYEPVNISMDIAVPFGMITGLELETTFESSDISPIPIRFVSSNIQAPASLSFANASLKFIGEKQFRVVAYVIEQANHSSSSTMPTHSSRRRRRRNNVYASNSLTIYRPVGDILNSISGGGTSGAILNFVATFLTDGSGAGFSGARFNMTAQLNYNGKSVQLGTIRSMFAQPSLTLSKYIETNSSEAAGADLVVATIHHNLNSTGNAYVIHYSDDIDCLQVIDMPASASCDNASIFFQRTALGVDEELRFTYIVSATDRLKYDSPTFRTATLNYSSLPLGEFLYPEYSGKLFGPISVSTCLVRKNDTIMHETWHNHLFSAITFLLVFLITTALILAALFLKQRWDRKKQSRAAANKSMPNNNTAGQPVELSPSDSQERLLPSITASDAQQEAPNAAPPAAEIEETAPTGIAAEPGLASALCSEELSTASSTMLQHRLEQLDLAMNLRVEKQLQTEMLSCLTTAQQTAIESLANNGEIRRTDCDAFVDLVQQKISNDFQQIDAECNTKATLNCDNKILTNDQSIQKAVTLNDEEKLAFMQTKAFIAKQMSLANAQSEIAKELLENGRIKAESFDAILAEIESIRQRVCEWYDAERAKQRSLLAEQDEVRKQLFAKKQLLDSQTKQVLDQLFMQPETTLDLCVKNGQLTAEQSQTVQSRLKSEQEPMKKWLAEETANRMRRLQNDLEAEKRKLIDDIKTRHRQELRDLERQLAEERIGGKNQLDLIQKRQQLCSNQRAEALQLDGYCNEEALKRMATTKQQLQQELGERFRNLIEHVLINSGVITETVGALLGQFDTQALSLQNQQEIARQKHSAILAEKLKQRKEMFSAQRSSEIVDQTNIRGQHNAVFQRCLDQAAAISETEREELIRRQRKNMAQFEKSLALTRIAQRRMFEEKLSQRRQRNQCASPEELLQENLESSQGAHQLRDVEHGEEDYLEKIQSEMLAERRLTLKKREEELAAVVAQLQLQKQRQLAELKKQAVALRGLTSCMVDDAKQRAALSTPQCSEILETHQREKQRINDQLMVLREKQQMALRKRLEERALQRKNELERRHLRVLTEVAYETPAMEGSGHVANALDVVNTMHEQLLEADSKGLAYDAEVQQLMAAEKHQFEVEKQQKLQEQELKLVESLVKAGNFQRSEMKVVLRLVFPDKSKKELKHMTKRLFGESEASEQQQTDTAKMFEDETNPSADTAAQTKSHLVEMVLQKSTEEEQHTDNPTSASVYGRGHRRKHKRHKHLGPNSAYDKVEGAVTKLPPISKRPEPVGASTDDIDELAQTKAITTVTHHQ